MKKIAAGLAGIVFAFSLTACGGAEAEPEAVTETVTVAPETEESETVPEVDGTISDAEFAALVREHTDEFDGATDAAIAEAGAAVCGIWEAGGTIDDVIEAVIGSGVNPEDGGFLAGAGTEAYCPEYSDMIPSGSSA